MMRRFARRRRGSGRSAAAPIDTASVLQRILEQRIVPAENLEPYEAEEVPPGFAALGRGEAKTGGQALVAFSPRHASHALLAALAVGGRLAEAESFSGEVYVVAPDWAGAGRRLFGLIGKLPYRVLAVAAPGLAEDGAAVSPESPAAGAVLSPSQIAGHLARPADRDLFLRAARGLEGLAAKHGGALRGSGRSLEFVLLARRVAELRAEHDGVVLITILPQRSSNRLSAENLSGSLDGLEGQLRKRLNDRRTRQGEEGLRARSIAAFRTWHSLRALVPWPFGGRDGEVIDWVGVDVEGRPVIGAARDQLGLEELASIIEGALGLQGSLPSVLAHAAPPVVLDAPRLVLGGSVIAPGVARALEALVLSHELFEIKPIRDTELELRPIGAGEAPSRESRQRRPSGRSRREAGADAPAEADSPSDEGTDGAAPDSAGEARGGSGGRGRSRRGRGRSRRGRGRSGGRDADAKVAETQQGDTPGDTRPRFDEVSLFDLDDEPVEREGGGRGRRRGRGRSRGGSRDDARGNRSAEEASPANADAPERLDDVDAPTSRPAGAPALDDADLDDGLVDEDAELALDAIADVPDFDAPVEPSYDDEEEMGDEGDPESKTLAQEREQRRKTRRSGPIPEAPVELPRLPRRRGAIVAHADRDSIIAAILIARDIRMVEGLWVYPQEELMSFFRGVTTDLREDTPIFVVGFTPKPVVDVLQAAALYRDRILWFDHHSWPPEDLQALRNAIGEDAVNVSSGCGSSLPPVIEACSRQSRFTDKLVDLVAARFTQHDYERWGRLWWFRLGELAKKTGDCRAEVEGLLAGRPSDLAREAAGVETPPIPPEVDYVSRRDFRLVHFAGYGLVVLDVPSELDLHLTARVVRERYGASLSLARRPDGEDVVFAGDELVGRRSLDLGGLVEHVANKLEWVERLADSDHVARMRVRDLVAHPDRLDEIVAEIAMGRSILER